MHNANNPEEKNLFLRIKPLKPILLLFSINLGNLPNLLKCKTPEKWILTILYVALISLYSCFSCKSICQIYRHVGTNFTKPIYRLGTVGCFTPCLIRFQNCHCRSLFQYMIWYALSRVLWNWNQVQLVSSLKRIFVIQHVCVHKKLPFATRTFLSCFLQTCNKAYKSILCIIQTQKIHEIWLKFYQNLTTERVYWPWHRVYQSASDGR